MTSVPENNNNGVSGTDSVLQLLQAVRSGDTTQYTPARNIPEPEAESNVTDVISEDDADPSEAIIADVSAPTETISAIPDGQVPESFDTDCPDSEPPQHAETELEKSLRENLFETDNSRPTASSDTNGSFGSFRFAIPEENTAETDPKKRRRRDHYVIKQKDERKRSALPFVILGIAFLLLCVTGNMWYYDGGPNAIKMMIWPDYRPEGYLPPKTIPFTDALPRLDLDPKIDVTVRFGRTEQKYTVMEGATAGGLVEICGISLDEEDSIEPDPMTVLCGGDTVTIHRTQYVERTVSDIPVPYSNITRPTPLLSKGSTRVVSYGKDGKAEQLFRDKYYDGEFVESELVSETVIKEPVSGVVRVGDPTASLSYIDGSKYTDIAIVNGVPEQYQSKISSGKCTAYSYPSGVYGGSGMYLFQGCVAVDPNTIPLGSLLYITNSDNSFVWGWAIAADSCEAAMYGINNVTVDCFLETYNDSLLFGAHYMDIYVVKQLTQSDLDEYIAVDGMFRARIPQ